MKLSTSGSSGGSQQGSEGGENKCLNSELWHACAGPLVCLPTAGTRVVYFPQGHSEQVSATTNKDVDGHIPNYPNLPPQLICQLHNVTMHADVETDEVYAQITLQPLSPQEQKDLYIPMELGCPSRQPTNYFCKTLTASDTSTHGGFSVPRRAAEKVFPPLDYTLQPPCQELIARDLHDVEWKFRHIFRGQPKRHLLTTGWSVFVSAKRLVAGDSVLFIWGDSWPFIHKCRNEKNQLFLGIRRATRPQNVMPSSVLSSDSMHIGLLAAAAHAAATNSCFTIFYNPRACPSEFVIPLSKYVKAVFHTRVSVGMRFRMLFETEESSVRRYMGTITGISDLDSVRWPNSHWRSVKVGWDESTAGDRQPRVSLWEIEPLTTFPMYPSLFPLRLKRPWHAGASPMQGNLNDPTNSLMWLRGDNNVEGLNSASFQSMGMLPWMQPQADQFLPMSNQNQLYQSMLSSQLQSLRSAPGDPLTAQLLQIQQPFSQQLQQSTGNIPFLQQQQQQQQQHQQRLQSVSQQMLPVHPQISKDGTSLQQQSHPLEFYKQQEASSSSQQQEQLHAPPQESFQLQNSERLIQQQRQQHLVGGINHSSHLKSELVGFNSELSTPHSTVATEILGSAGGPHVSTFNHSQMSEQPVLAQHNLMNSSYSQFNAFANTVSLPPCPGGKDGSSPLESGNMGLDLLRHYHHQPPAPHHSTLNTNVDSSGLILPMTMPSNHHSSSSGDEGMCSAALGVYQSNMLDGIGMVNSPELHSGRQGDLLPPMNPVFVKVYKTGSVGRSLDISRFSSYDELREELGRMFGIEGKLENPQRSGWQLVFVDRENDILLLGDDPWESFVSNVWSIKILSPEDVLELGKQVTESLG